MRSIALLFLATANFGQTPITVNKAGQLSVTKLEHVVDGYLQEMNGKYKLRVTETTYAPGGYIGNHHHAGPGIRCIRSGELTYVQQDQTTVYKTGDCFYESGVVSHTAYNRTTQPVSLLNFEVLPVGFSGASPIPVPKGAGVVPEPGRR